MIVILLSVGLMVVILPRAILLCSILLCVVLKSLSMLIVILLILVLLSVAVLNVFMLCVILVIVILLSVTRLFLGEEVLSPGKCLSVKNALAYSIITSKKIKKFYIMRPRAQCHKTFYNRNLRICVIS